MKNKLINFSSTLLLSTFLLGGITADASTYSLDDVTVKRFDYSIRYSGNEMFNPGFNDGLMLFGYHEVDDEGEYLRDENDYYISHYGYYNGNGELVIPVDQVKYGVSTQFSEGLAPYIVSLIPDSYEAIVGFMDTTGTPVIEPMQCEFAYNFSNGITTLQGENVDYIIDQEGNLLHTYPQGTPYEQRISLFSQGIGVVENNYVDKYGNMLIETAHYLDTNLGYTGLLTKFSDGIAHIRMSSEVSHEKEIIFFDTEGNELFRKTANAASEYQDGLAIIGYKKPATDNLANATSYSPYNLGDEMTFMDKTGTEFPEKYIGIRPFSEGLAAVQNYVDLDGDGRTELKWGFIDKTGTLVIDYQFDHISFFSEGYAFVGEGSGSSVYANWAVIDTTGTLQTDYIYGNDSTFSEGLAAVKIADVDTPSSSNYYFIDTKGNIIIDLDGSISQTEPFQDGVSFITKDDFHATTYLIRNPLSEEGYTAPESAPEIAPESTPETAPTTATYAPWAETQVVTAEENGLIVDSLGMDYTKSITREQIAHLLVNMIEKYTGEIMAQGNSDTFTDTSNESVLKAYESGIISGKDVGIFDPTATATRQEISIMILRAIETLENQSRESYIDHTLTHLDGYGDIDSISSWATEFMAILANNNLMTGSDGNLNPLSETSIQECLVLNNNLFMLGK